MGCDTCRELLAEGLDLCVRARQMDAMDRREAALKASKVPDEWLESGKFDEYVERHNIDRPHTPIATRSGTVRLWVEEQYQTDLADWEKKSRHHLMQGCRAALERSEGSPVHKPAVDSGESGDE